MITLEILTHDGNSYIEQVSEYDAQALNDEINNNDVLTVVIGSRIISRIKIAEISVISVDIPDDSAYNETNDN